MNRPEQLLNYLNGSVPTCNAMFTAGQVSRMEAAITYNPPPPSLFARGAVASSDGLIPPPASPAGDLWSRDGAGDTGQEPNTATDVPWASDDIWVRTQADGVVYQTHEDPVFAPGVTNHVYVRVRNRGCQQAASQNVTLYWAKASTQLGWPSPWNGQPPGAPQMGQPIGTLPTGTLAAGESKVLDFTWSSLPNPADYASFGGDATHFCLLSTIGSVSQNPQNLANLVTSSNKVVWKNVTVATDSANDVAAVSVQGTPDGAPATFEFKEPTHMNSPGSVFDWGTVRVDLGAGLFGRWVEGGSHSTGVVAVSGTTVTLAASGATLSNVLLRPQDLFTLKVLFLPRAPVSQPLRAKPDIYFLDLTQFAERLPPPGLAPPPAGNLELVGGQRFVLKTRAPLPLPEPPR